MIKKIEQIEMPQLELVIIEEKKTNAEKIQELIEKCEIIKILQKSQRN